MKYFSFKIINQASPFFNLDDVFVFYWVVHGIRSKTILTNNFSWSKLSQVHYHFILPMNCHLSLSLNIRKINAKIIMNCSHELPTDALQPLTKK